MKATASGSTRKVHRTKTALALEALREGILQGEIKPGERLMVARLAEELGMSATPIREAIRILGAEGLINHRPHYGVSVADLSLEDAREIYMLRGYLEELATRLAVPRLTDQDIEKLKALENDMQQACASGDRDGLTKANADWHLCIYRASGTKHLLGFILRLWALFPWDTIWVIPGRREQSLAEHAEIMRAILARDAETAGRLMHDHVLSGQSSVMQHLLQHGQNTRDDVSAR